MSPRPGSSTLMTSAPSQARICVHEGPAWTCVMSRILIPSRALRTGSPSPEPFEETPLTLMRLLLVHRLVHRPRRVLVRVDPDVDERDLAGRADGVLRALQRGRYLFGIANGFAVAAEHLRELLEV